VQACAACDRPLDGFGIMRRDHASSESDVGEVLAIGVEFWVRQVRWPGEGELFTVGERRLQPAR
jgi:hypothetical protein